MAVFPSISAHSASGPGNENKKPSESNFLNSTFLLTAPLPKTHRETFHVPLGASWAWDCPVIVTRPIDGEYEMYPQAPTPSVCRMTLGKGSTIINVILSL